MPEHFISCVQSILFYQNLWRFYFSFAVFRVFITFSLPLQKPELSIVTCPILIVLFVVIVSLKNSKTDNILIKILTVIVNKSHNVEQKLLADTIVFSGYDF